MEKRTDAQRRQPRDNRGRNWSDAATVKEHRGWPLATRSWKGQGRILPSSLEREYGPAETLIPDFWPPEL